MHQSNALTRILFTTSSLAALIAADFGATPAFAACTDGGSSGFTNPTGSTISCLQFSANNTGNAVNNGTITPGSPVGIIITSSTFAGTIANTGLISAPNIAVGIGIAISGTATVTGGITNSGTLSGGSRAAFISQVGSFGGGITNSGTATGGGGLGQFRVSLFTGGIVNSGGVTAFASGISALADTTFTGGITNTGSISARTGISSNGTTTFLGGITNTGTITGSNIAGIRVRNTTTFGGGITNSGTISNQAGIQVSGGSTFSGGITNSGSVTGVNSGLGVQTTTTFMGGITNTGRITAKTGINSNAAVNFLGGITNSGTITGSNLAGIRVNNTANFAGGITNSGNISNLAGIVASGGSTFSGGIANSGSVTGVNSGLAVQTTTTFMGGINNTGTVSAKTGINVNAAVNFLGGLTNAGTITGSSLAGIRVNNTSTFVGGITNSGSISNLAGIVVSGGSSFSGPIDNSGNITGTGGTAIDLSTAPSAITVNQTAGIVTGAIKLSAFADVLNVSGGTLNGNITGSGSTNTVNFAPTSGTFTYDSPYSISGVNQLNINSGLVTLNGINSATNVAVNSTLVVGDASNPGATLTATNLTVASGGTLAGHGTVAANVAIASGATLSPGTSIGTLNVGSIGIAAGSTYAVEVNASGQNDKTVATGTATLTGGTVHVMEQPGSYPPTFTYTILTANGGVTGTFDSVTNDIGILTPTLNYDAFNVYLILARNTTFFSSKAQTANQLGVAQALDFTSLGNPIVQAVQPLSAADSRVAFDALSGEVHASVVSTLLDDAHYFRQAIGGRLRQASYAGASDVMAALAFVGPVRLAAAWDEAAPAAGEPLAYDKVAAFPTKAPPPQRPFVSDVTFWSQGVGAWGRFDGDGNAAGVRRDLGGFFAGVDARFGDFARIGFASGYTHSSVNVDDRASSAGINTFHLGGYGGTQVGPVNLRAGGAYAFHTINTDRAIVFPGLIDAAHASYDASTAQAFGEIGYGLALGRFAVEPFGGLAYVRVQTDGFLENGGIAALAGAGNSNEVVYSSLGVRAATSIPLANGTALIPRATLAWQHAFGDVTPAASLALAAGGVGYAINGVPIARDAALVEAGLDLRVLPQLKVGLSYAGELAGNAQDHAVKGNLTWNF